MKATDPIQRPKRKKKILILGSDLERLKSIRDFMEDRKMETICSLELSMGEDLSAQENFACILVDFVMIKGNYHEWTGRIKSMKSGNHVQRVVVFMDKAHESYTEPLLKAGVDSCVAASGDESDFLNRLYDCVEEFKGGVSDRESLTITQLEEEDDHRQGSQHEFMDEIARMSSKLEDALIRETKLRKELEIVNKTKDELLGFAAHDLRSPLSTILSSVQFITDPDMEIGPLNESQLRFLQVVINQAKHLINLVNEFLDLSKIQAGFVELSLSSVNMKSIIIEKCYHYSIQAEKKSITLTKEIEEGLPTIEADENKIASVFDNLIGNAVKYCSKGDQVTVRARRRDGSILIEVEDTGQGLKKEELCKVFGAFQRLSARPTAGESSTGLGLAIVKKIVNAHGGEVGVVSELGKGSVFHFTLRLDGIPKKGA